MSRDLKFDYVCKCDSCGRFKHDYCTLDQIQDRIDADFVEYESCDVCADGVMVLVDRRQLIGRKDKNDTEIYHGDIILRTEYKPGIYVVIWDDYRSAWWLKNIKERDREYDDDFCQLLGDHWDKSRREVIGNRFENPELLED